MFYCPRLCYDDVKERIKGVILSGVMSEFINVKYCIHQAIKNMARATRVLYNRSQENKRYSKEKRKPVLPIGH